MAPNRSRRRTPDATGNPPLIDQLDDQINRVTTAPRITIQADHFDYDALPSGTAPIASVAAQDIKEALRRMKDQAFVIGAALVRIKEALPHGAFSNWLAAEFGWSERTAQRFMAVAIFGENPARVSHLSLRSV
jgi:Protein of unknown function (DUF3102)